MSLTPPLPHMKRGHGLFWWNVAGSGSVLLSQTIYSPFTHYMERKESATHQYRASGSGLHQKTVEKIQPHSHQDGTCQTVRAKVTKLMWNLLHSQESILSMSYQQLTSSMEHWLLHTLFMSEVSPQISDVTSAYIKNILACVILMRFIWVRFKFATVFQ